MSDNATLSDILFPRRARRFRRSTVVISAAVGYDSRDDSRRACPLRTAPRPRLGPAGGPFREYSEAEAPFFAGAALAALDSVAKSDPPWAGVFRRRLALKSAAAVTGNLLTRREDEAALRDAVALARPAQELGPAGRVYSAFRTLCRHGDPFRPARLSAVAADLQAPLDPGKAAELAAALRETGGHGRPAPLAAAAAAEAVIKIRADAGPLALLCADAALARALGWPVAAPLLAGELFSRNSSGEGRRPRPGEAGWTKAVSLATARAALAALDLAQDLSRRAGRLADAAPKLRAKGKGSALEALLADDAVSAAAPIAGLSDRARRRLFERLVALGAARELTGRPTFRLYGL